MTTTQLEWVVYDEYDITTLPKQYRYVIVYQKGYNTPILTACRYHYFGEKLSGEFYCAKWMETPQSNSSDLKSGDMWAYLKKPVLK
jgi:hypothetical protein